MSPKEKFSYLGKIAFLMFGAIIALFGGIYLPITLKFSVFNLIGMLLCFTGAGILILLSYLLFKEYKYKIKNT